jgi:hypothetical protein
MDGPRGRAMTRNTTISDFGTHLDHAATAGAGVTGNETGEKTGQDR